MSVRIRVRGLVQGVGFRPFVWRLAHEEGLTGSVCNDADGVLIEAHGSGGKVETLLARLQAEAPPLARLEQIEVLPAETAAPLEFTITASRAGKIATGIVPDAATCPACLAEIRTPNDRRYAYPFANCTHCGPRLSIVRAVPYDRATTAMAAFAMCADCAREYGDPGDRRFHAEPIACPACGPRLWLEGAHGTPDGLDPIAAAVHLIHEGRIVAIKGIGGFHLACDARNPDAVDRLRRRKVRDAKPFALMVEDIAMARRYVEVSEAEARLLASPAAPIVLLAHRRDGDALSASIAPGMPRLGMMLPYTPLHHILAASVARPLVMTSGNRASEPQVATNEQAREHLAGIADAILMHDRDIVNRLDDSIMRIDRSGPIILRRARGFAPAPVRLAPTFDRTPTVLALGGLLKATFCILRDGQATLSQHLGDLDEPATYEDYHKALTLYRDVFGVRADAIAVDLHPDFASTALGEHIASADGLPLIRVQHHHAHFAACLAENGIARDAPPALGIVLDGLGLGDDGTVWGGELLLGGYAEVRRVGHLTPFHLPGGDLAMREPWRNAFVQLRQAFADGWQVHVDGLEIGRLLQTQRLDLLVRQIERGVNAPLASSAGRLFDAAAALAGIAPSQQSYEGQAAMAFEAHAAPFMPAPPYPFALCEGATLQIDPRPVWPHFLSDLRAGAPPGFVAARFHAGLIHVFTSAARSLARDHGIRTVALTGGVLQNAILADGLCEQIRAAGLDVLRHSIMPANDGSLSLGQAAVAAARLGSSS